jgi:hypothetical protein
MSTAKWIWHSPLAGRKNSPLKRDQSCGCHIQESCAPVRHINFHIGPEGASSLTSFKLVEELLYMYAVA